jgi:methylated-DNA-[protein]-cysteine S-methyltransferase
MKTKKYARIDSPVGRLLLVGEVGDGTVALSGLYFEDAPHAHAVLAADAREDRAAFAGVIAQLEEYFAGRRTSFDLTLAPRGTPFQERVWCALTAIPHGTTTTYGAIARSIGKPTAARAVGAANGKNPISIVVPCHRVVGENGALTGYAGGMRTKRTLLALEARVG